MKYSKGDKVRIWNIDWYEQMLSIPSKLVWQNKLTEDFIGIWCGSHVFRKEMREFCGMVMTIQEVGIDFYLMEEDRMGYEFTDEMIAGEDVSWMYDGNLVAERFGDDKEVPKFKVGDKITNGKIVIDVVGIDNGKYIIKDAEGVFGMLCFSVQGEWDIVKEKGESIEPKFKVGDKILGVDVNWIDDDKTVAERFGDVGIKGNISLCKEKYNTLCINGEMCADRVELKLSPEFEIKEEDGKWFAVKKRSRYPQSYEECCEVLSMPSYYKLRYSTYEHGYHEYTTSKDLGVLQYELGTLGKLLICRDAYWLTAGREMGLEGKWKPVWSDCRMFSIVVEGDKILTDVCLRRNRILVFPTEEMRDEFLKVFRNDIEECKELL